MKILWHSNAPFAATGYGQQTAQVISRLDRTDHQIAVSAFYGLHGSVLDWQGIRIYPGGADGFGSDVIVSHAITHFQGKPNSGLTIALADSWVLRPEAFAKLTAAIWCPIDHSPVPPKVAAFFRQSGAIPIAMSKFGRDELKAAELDPLYVPHAIDTSTFRPMEKDLARRQLGWPADAFIVGMVAANKGTPSRKSFPEAIRAFKQFSDKHDDAMLYLHTELSGVANGIHLGQLMEMEGIPHDRVIVADQYQACVLGAPREYMRQAYSAMDVLLNPSQGEGFGIPVLEAQACGTPVITSNFSAMRELTEAGWLVGGQQYWTYQDSWMFIPSIEEIVSALKSAHGTAARQSKRAVEFAQSYDADRIFRERWLPTLDSLSARVTAATTRSEGEAAPTPTKVVMPPEKKLIVP